MSFDSIDRILKEIEQQPGWELQQQYRLLLQCWSSIVEPKVALHTRPLYVMRKVLWVATSSSVWAQNLSMQRYSLLKKLNAKLSEQLIDIRFSPAKWHSKKSSSTESHKIEPVNEARVVFSPTEENTSKTTFQRWSDLIKARSQNFPVCPQCQSPTPPEELQRWQVCAYCATQQWTQERPKN
jgi:predicted nucleic acid-binding Zn ribbon protein